jgi:hypothetical protein
LAKLRLTSTMKPRARLPMAIIALLFCTSALASTAIDRQNAKSARHIEETIPALTDTADADSLAAAGLLSLEKHPAQSLPLIERAIAAAPTRADLRWLQIEVCLKLHSCDPVPLENRMREADPTNAAAWAGALARASAAHDEEAIDTALATIADKQRFDIYWTTLISRLSDAIIRTHKMSPTEALVAVIGYQAAAPISGYTAAALACKGDRLQRPGVMDACRGVARVFQQGDSILAEAIGFTIAKRVWPEDSREWKAAVAAQRVYDHRSKLWLKINRDDNPNLEQYLQLCRTNRREQDLRLAQIIAAGENPDDDGEAPTNAR